MEIGVVYCGLAGLIFGGQLLSTGQAGLPVSSESVIGLHW